MKLQEDGAERRSPQQLHSGSILAPPLLRFVAVACALLLLTVSVTVAGAQCVSSLDSSFPSGDVVARLTETDRLGSVEHQRYVVSVFDAMRRASAKCDSRDVSKRVHYEGIGKAVFSAGEQSRFAEQEQQFGFNNARSLVNLLAAAPPRAPSQDISPEKASYCLREECPSTSTPLPTTAAGVTTPGSTGGGTCQCGDCNIWFNDIFLDTLLQSAVETHERIVASGMCWRNSPTSLSCREVTDIRSQPTTLKHDVQLADCSEPWLWHQPRRALDSFLANHSFVIDDDVELVPAAWVASSGIREPEYRDTHVSIPRIQTDMLSWSTAQMQCRRNDTSQWTHILTAPLVANCSERLASLGMCNVTADGSNIVMVGSSWVAVSLAAYNILQCNQSPAPAASSTPTQSKQQQAKDVFQGSALCSRVHVLGNDSSQTLQCANAPSGFKSNSYNCTCPQKTYFSWSAAMVKGHDFGTAAEPLVTGYPGNVVASMVVTNGSAIGNVYNHSCFQCEPGCTQCNDSTPCLREDDLRLRTPLLVLTLLTMVAAVAVGVILWWCWDSPIVVSSVGTYLLAILASALVAYVEGIVLFPRLTDTTCIIQPWPRHVGFILIFGFLFGKIWRVQVLARMPPGSISPGHLDRIIVMCISFLAALMVVFLAIWTAVAAPSVTIAYDSKGDSYELCSVDRWRYSIHGVEVLLLILACLVAHRTRRLVLEWPEFKFIALPFLNAAIIKSLIAIFYFTLMPDKYPDYLYLLQFFELHFSITSLVAVLCGHKLYFIFRKKKDRDVGPTVPSKKLASPSSPVMTQDRITSDNVGGEVRRDSGIEVASLADYQQQHLQAIAAVAQQGDAPQYVVVPNKVSLRDVLLSCVFGGSADDWEATGLQPAPNGSGSNENGSSGARNTSQEAPCPPSSTDPPSPTEVKELGSVNADRERKAEVTPEATDGDDEVPILQTGLYGGVPASNNSSPKEGLDSPGKVRRETSL